MENICLSLSSPEILSIIVTVRNGLREKSDVFRAVRKKKIFQKNTKERGKK